MNSIHGHEVLDLLLQNDGHYTRESLRGEAIERFGSTARFHTCSMEDLSLEELLTFLEARGKFKIVDGTLFIDRDEICKRP